jgi:peptidoglycan/LPS O-acetylase OafA/YrhL
LNENGLNPEHKFITSLTLLRFFAAVFVVVHHIGGLFPQLYLVQLVAPVGWLGVSFFFILSGFVLMWSFDAGISKAEYVFRRLTRIYPLHFACLVTCLLFFWATGAVLGGYKGTPLGTIANFLLVQAWIPGHPDVRQAWNGVSWTLSCEFMFYLLTPFLFPILMQINWRRYGFLLALYWIAIICTASLAQENSWGEFLDFFFYSPVPRLFEFILGAVSAVSFKSGTRYNSRSISIIVMVVPNFVYCLAVPEPLRCSLIMDYLFIPGAVLLIISMVTNEFDFSSTWTKNPLLIELGDASFSLYMIHAMLIRMFVIFIFATLGSYFQSSFYLEAFLAILFLFVATIISLVIHRRFEVPVRIILMRLLTSDRNLRSSRNYRTSE